MNGTKYLAAITVFAALCQVAVGGEPRTLPNRYSSVLTSHHRSGCSSCDSPAPSYSGPSCAAPACCAARPCGGCNRCCPGILPAIGCGVVKVVRGAGAVVSCVLGCGRRCGSCNDAWADYQPSCCARPSCGRCCLARPACQSYRCCNGCDSCRGGATVTDPFHDDPEIPQPVPAPASTQNRGASRQRTTPYAAAARSNNSVTKKAPTPAAPRTFVAKASATEPAPTAPRMLTVAANEAKKLDQTAESSDSQSSRRTAPRNPLRD